MRTETDGEEAMLKIEMFCCRLVTRAAGHKTTHKLLSFKWEVPHLGR